MRSLCLLALLSLPMSAFGANLITNGTFDNNCAGWSLSQTDGFTCSSTEGNPGFALVLNNGPGPVPTASQTIGGLEIGGVYSISLDAKTHYNCCNSSTTPGSSVSIDGNTFQMLIVDNQPWTTYGPFTFTYDGGSNVFSISSQTNGTDSDGEFDNVSLTLLEAPPSGVPEPGSMALLIAGGAALIAFARKR